MSRLQVLVVAFVVGAAALSLSWLLSGLLVGGSYVAVKGQAVLEQIEAEEAASREAQAAARLEAIRAEARRRNERERAAREARARQERSPLPIAPWAELPEFRPPRNEPRAGAPRPEQWIHQAARLPAAERSSLAASYAPIALLWEGKYAEVDATLDAWVGQPVGDDGIRPTERALFAFGTLGRSLPELKAWLQASPESYWARLLTARALRARAWEIRSNAYPSAIPEERMQGFVELSRLATSLTLAAARQAPSRPYAWADLYEIEKSLPGLIRLPPDLAEPPADAPAPYLPAGDGSPPPVDEVLLRWALRARPVHRVALVYWASYSRPRWGGSLEELRAIERWIHDTYESEDPRVVQDRWHVFRLLGDSFGATSKPLEDPRVRADLLAGYWRALERHPAWDAVMNSIRTHHSDRESPGARRTLARLQAHVEQHPSPQGWMELGEHFFAGKTREDHRRAEAAYRKAMALGHPDAPRELGSLLRDKVKDPSRHEEWLRLFLLNSVRGQFGSDFAKVGAYFQDLEPPHGEPDMATATLWFDAAARFGRKSNIYWMGKFFQEGEHVEKDLAHAQAWWRAGAARGEVRSMALLAQTLEDAEEARAWLELAAQEGSEWARERLAEEADQ